MEYEVVIVGAGPAGIFAALTLADLGIDSVLLLEQGKDLEKRSHEAADDRLCGWGGAGAYSDGKLTLSTHVGGVLGKYLEERSLYQLLDTADGIYAAHGAPDRIFGERTARLDALAERARLADLELVPSRIRHIGTENCRTVLERFRSSLAGRVETRTECKVEGLTAEGGRIQGVILGDGSIVHSRFVIAAPGRSGATWMKAAPRREIHRAWDLPNYSDLLWSQLFIFI